MHPRYDTQCICSVCMYLCAIISVTFYKQCLKKALGTCVYVLVYVSSLGMYVWMNVCIYICTVYICSLYMYFIYMFSTFVMYCMYILCKKILSYYHGRLERTPEAVLRRLDG